jgi:hypothetical protein
MKTLLTLALLLTPGLAEAKKPKLPPYAQSIRCAGLAEVAARPGKDGKRPESGTAFDAAIFWGMAASEAARNNGISGEQFTADQLAAAAKAEKELFGPGTDALTELARCIARVPPDPPAGKGKRG